MKNDKSLEQLKGICYRRAYVLYGVELFRGYKSRIDYELARIRSIPGGADAFLQTREFISVIRNLWNSQKGGSRLCMTRPRLTFRGPVLAGLVAYLCGITEYDPVEWKFYAWTFLRGAKVVEFNLDVTLRMYDLIRQYDLHVPSCVIIRVDIDQSILEEAEMCGENYRSNLHNSRASLREINREIKVFCREAMRDDPDALQYVWDDDERMVSEAEQILSYLGEIDQLPESLEDLVKLNGFLHNTLRDGSRLQMLNAVPELYVYDGMIAYPEDIYDALVRKGCSGENAQRIARTVQRAGRTLAAQDQALLEEYCGQAYALMASQTEHLFYKAQTFGKTIGSAELMRWYNHEPGILQDAYERVEGLI